MESTQVRRVVGPVAAGAIVLALALNAFGVYGGRGGEGEHGIGAFLAVCALIAVASVVVFGFVVPRGLVTAAAGVTALVLAVLGLLTVPVFWSGLPPILAAGAVLLGWAGWNADRGRNVCRAAVVIGVLVLTADVIVYVFDWLAST